MPLRTRSLAGRAIAAAATLTVLAAPLAVTTAGAQAADSQVEAARPALKVMTRNLYLGVDILRPLDAVSELPPGSDLPTTLTALGNASDEAWDIVVETNFGVRSKLLAQEIADAGPDLVGLQEVALWRHGPLSLENVAAPAAAEVDLDFLKMLRAELKAAGAPYRPVSVNTLSDVEAPAFEGAFGTPEMTDARNIRVTMRDVILKRVGSGIDVLRHREREYSPANQLPITIANIPLDFNRGYQWADVKRDGQKFRFINTHLEAFSSDIAYRQIKEMLKGPGSYQGTTIIVCDCNSDPLLEQVKPIDTRPHSDPYWLAVGKHDFHDTWLQWKPARFGWTSGLSETVDDADASGFDHRIDMVFARTGEGRRLRVVSGAVTGNTLASKDPTTGLWPSDHAGVVMTLRGLARD